MTERSASHATFVVDRTYPASPARAFAAWADPKAKAVWFTGQAEPDYTLDFRVGGREVTRGGPPGGPVYSYEATYQDIVTNERIVYAYVMDKDAQRISASVATVEFQPVGAGVRVLLTEQGVYLDGGDRPEIRQGGIEAQFDALGRALLTL
jgi:uncharacterized protein YndB with AHSA1/START domain